jgi:uncharacterized protein (DUF1501 family)
MLRCLAHPAALSRRQLLVAASALANSFALPVAARMTPIAIHSLRSKRLIVLTLVGGNDGLNTLVPVSDPMYRKLRPTVALPKERLLPLNDDLSLHPALVSTMASFQSGELAIVQDVGYPRPNLSHAGSTAIWDSADPLRGTAAEFGWWGEVVMQNRMLFDGADLDAAAVTFESSAAFAAGSRVPVLRARPEGADPFGTSGAAPFGAATPEGSPQGRYSAAVRSDEAQVQARFAQRLRNAKRPVWQGDEQLIDAQVKLTDWFLSNGVATPLLHLALGGFDTHSELLARHGGLMAVLDRTLSDLRSRLLAVGRWDDTVVLVQSEFGRRPAENGHGGTDHGTTGPVLLLGGRVQGGVYGERAALDRLDNDGNPIYRTDFRRIYSGVVSDLFCLPVNPFTARGFAPLSLRLA